jgi:hypothetical protein
MYRAWLLVVLQQYQISIYADDVLAWCALC